MDYSPTQDKISAILRRAIALPLGLMAVLAVILTLAVVNLLSTVQWVTHSDEVVAEAQNILRDLVNMETGLRGYALTSSREFLEPYVRSRESIDHRFDDLLRKIKDNPPQTERINQVRAMYRDWQTYASQAQALLAIPSEQQKVDWNGGKQLMDRMRMEIDDFADSETKLRQHRSNSAERATIAAVLSSVGVSIVAGLIMAWLTRGQLRNVSETYRRALESSDKRARELQASEHEREVLLERAREDQVREHAARTAAERANRMKDEFLSNLSHELRTPLNAILGWADLLAMRRAGEEEIRQGIEIIQRNARVQTQLIDDLLDMSRIISGKIRLEVQRLDITSVVNDAVASVRPTAEAKGILLQATLETIDRQVAGDAARLQQIVWNLLSNAIKFTPRKGRVQVLLERVNSHIEITVADTGQGIDPEFLPFVFDRFSQEDGSTTRRYGGIGLGLAIVKQLVELHGGRVRAKSPGEGQGSTFIVDLPLTPVHAEQNEPQRFHPAAITATATDEDRPKLKGVRVLVVDDEPDARQLIGRILSGAEAQVLFADSARTALEILNRDSVDVLVSDIGMPELDGYELIRSVREQRSAAELPAVALTAYARSEDRRRALRSGFQMHVVKPVEPSELLAVVASVADRHVA